MNFAEIQQEVIDFTKRPDKLAEIKAAINDSIQFYSIATTFSHDLVEDSLAIDPSQYAQNIIISSSFLRFRKLKYLKPTNQKFYLDWIDPSSVFTDKGCEQLNKWYRGGDKIYFKLRTLSSSLDYGYYAYPQRLLLNTDSHWMFEVQPGMIRKKACSEIFTSIGNQEEANRYKAEADGLFLLLRNDLADGFTNS